MSLSRKLLRANIILILVSVTAHEVAANSFVFLGLTVVVCLLKWRMDRHERSFHLDPDLSDLICAIAFAIMFIRSLSTTHLVGIRVPDIRISVMGQFLVILQWVYLFRRKRPRDYIWVYLVSVVHIGSAGLMMPGVGYAFFFVLYMASGLSALYVFNAWCTQERVKGPSTAPTVRPHMRFFMLSIVAMAAISLPLAGVFMALPRRRGILRLRGPLRGLSVQPMSGFSDQVRLGTIGSIQENPRRVMRLTVHDAATNEPLRSDELLLRGVALDTYLRANKGNWLWSSRAEEFAWAPGSSAGGETEITPAYRVNFPGFNSGWRSRIRCDITLEPLHTSYLFAPFAPESITLPDYRRLWFHPLTHVMRYSPRLRQQMRYSVVSRIFKPEAPSGSQPPLKADGEMFDLFLQLPENLSPRIGELARLLTPDAEYRGDYAKAMRILSYLSDERQFTYTLNMPPTRGVEPVENFLFHAKRGHCEYFASAMALMLREIGIPSRIVNGFKVTEWNPIGNHYTVRQSDAHSWVEAYLRPYGWRTLDPGVMRSTAIPRPRFARRWWRNLNDTAESLWVNHVLNYDNESRSRLTRMAANISRHVARPFRNLSGPLFTGSARIKSWAMIALILVLIPAAFLGYRKLMPWLGTGVPGARHAKGVFEQYRKMERLLARRGFRRNAWQTPWEFFDAIAEVKWPESEAVGTVTQTFCGARYGDREISPEETRHVEEALRRIKHQPHKRKQRLA